MNNTNIDTFCTAWRTGLRSVWNLSNTTHSDLLQLLSDDLPIFDELCRRSLMFIYKCLFHSSRLVKFVSRYGVMFARQKSTIGSNFQFCVSRFKFSKSAFFNGCININHMDRQHCYSFTDDSDRRYCVAQFLRLLLLLRDRPS